MIMSVSVFLMCKGESPGMHRRKADWLDQLTWAANVFTARNGCAVSEVALSAPMAARIGPPRSAQRGLGAATDGQQGEQVGIALARAQEIERDGLAHQEPGLERDEPHLVRKHIAHAPGQQRAPQPPADQ